MQDFREFRFKKKKTTSIYKGMKTQPYFHGLHINDDSGMGDVIIVKYDQVSKDISEHATGSYLVKIETHLKAGRKIHMIYVSFSARWLGHLTCDIDVCDYSFSGTLTPEQYIKFDSPYLNKKVEKKLIIELVEIAYGELFSTDRKVKRIS